MTDGAGAVPEAKTGGGVAAEAEAAIASTKSLLGTLLEPSYRERQPTNPWAQKEEPSADEAASPPPPPPPVSRSPQKPRRVLVPTEAPLEDGFDGGGGVRIPPPMLEPIER